MLLLELNKGTMLVLIIHGVLVLFSRYDNSIAHTLRKTSCYSPQTKFAKVMFLQVSVCPQGGGVAFMARGHMWQGACMVGGVCGGGGVCVVVGGACVAGGNAWRGACMVGRVCMAGGVHGRGACVADTTR